MVIPNLFYKKSLPESVPKELQNAVSKVKRAKTRREALKIAYKIITSKYFGAVVPTYTKFTRLFGWDIKSVWKEKGYMHCTKHNYIMRFLLVKSGWFKERDIKQKVIRLCYASPHQYLQVRVNGAWVDVDCWGKSYDVPFGRHSTCENFKHRK